MQYKNPWLTPPVHLDPPATRSLSLLFILQEWIDMLDQIKNLAREAEDPSSQGYPSFFSTDPSFPQKWICPDKLYFYCEILLKASKIEDLSLLKDLEEMRIAILQLKSQMLESKDAFTQGNSEMVFFLRSFHQKLLCFFSKLVPFLYEARTDENVLIRLIEDRKRINEYLGEQTIEKILQSFFPSGHAHLKAIICEGFTRRGFTSFFAEKEHLIDEIEWESPCLATHN